MVSEFTVFGSCTCRDIFNSTINKNYKDYFHINPSGIRVSYISLMHPPVDYTEESLIIHPETKKNINFSNWIKQDLDKSFLNELKKNKSEYLIIDTYYDVNFGIIEFENKNYITNNLHIDKTEFYKNLNYKKVMTIQSNKNEYLKLWKENCNLFFNFLEKYCPDTKIILNPTRHVTNLIRADGTISEMGIYKKISEKYNPYRDLLDSHIIENFNVDVLYFDENTLASENSIWGASSLHYNTSYFMDVTKQLNEFIKRNKILDNANEKRLNNLFKKQNRNLLTFKIQLNNNEKINKIVHKFKQNNTYKNLLKNNNEITNNITELKDILTSNEYAFLNSINNSKLSQIKQLKLK
ncbi:MULTISPECIES: DUF6270 domain-containing protein [Methanobrevibacter]|nr:MULTISPECIES: DUF6270 domain-containing protein [Methanobrevibacter]OEC97012.1 hypothetical protein A9505_06050 [Methanobrevibacter sp. A27]